MANLLDWKDGALRTAKQGAKAKAKAEFKGKAAEIKYSKQAGEISGKQARAAIGEERGKYRAAKKEIRKYTDY